MSPVVGAGTAHDAPVIDSAGRRPGGADRQILGTLMLAFDGREVPAAVAARLRDDPAAGVTLFRYHNVDSAGQVRELTASLQRAAAGATEREGSGAAGGSDAPTSLPLLIAVDQEGGQLQGLGDDLTPFAGNMALGAVGDEQLAELVARANGLELRALGVNVSYSPSCDVATNPRNPAMGIRSFGDDPVAVARLAAATVRGLRSAGVAATAKHFPGLGDLAVDSHEALGIVGHARPQLDTVEVPPFRGAIEAGADMVMSAHVAVPALTGDRKLPATLSRAVMHDFLRGELGFGGLSITDALDMRALPQGGGQAPAVVAAIRAGVDLLLCAADEEARRRIEAALLSASREGLFDGPAIRGSIERQHSLRRRLGALPQPGMELVDCPEHWALARELARRSITLVRDDAGLLPLRLGSDARVAAIMPLPKDLTPADTSSTVVPMLAQALRLHHGRVESFVTGHPPTDAEIAGLVELAPTFDLLVIGTLSAALDAQQVALVDALLRTGVPSVTVALRTPWDLAAYPAARTHLCTYGIHRPSLDALADVLWGAAAPVGHLPVAIEGIAPRGHGLSLAPMVAPMPVAAAHTSLAS